MRAKRRKYSVRQLMRAFAVENDTLRKEAKQNPLYVSDKEKKNLRNEENWLEFSL